MNQVVDVRRRDTFDVERNLHAAETAKAALEKENELLRSQRMDSDELLRRYEQMFGTVPRPV